MTQKSALITGITGQDGAWLAQLLLNKGYTVYGAIRQSSRPPTRLHKLGIFDDIHAITLDVTEPSNLIRALERAQPELIFHLAAPSFVGASFDQPAYTLQVIASGCAHLLDAVRLVQPQARLYNASTSEMFGKSGLNGILSATSPFCPQSPYAIAKCAAHQLVALERQAYGRFAVNGILFNHESPLRGSNFVTRHISLGVAQIARGRTSPLALGQLDARRDWGWAPEYVQAMFHLLTHTEPLDLVIATGVSASVRDFAQAAFAYAGMPLVWEGQGIHEIGRDTLTGQVRVRVDPSRFRPAEVYALCGDTQPASQHLGWQASTHWESIAHRMVKADLQEITS